MQSADVTYTYTGCCRFELCCKHTANVHAAAFSFVVVTKASTGANRLHAHEHTRASETEQVPSSTRASACMTLHSMWHTDRARSVCQTRTSSSGLWSACLSSSPNGRALRQAWAAPRFAEGAADAVTPSTCRSLTDERFELRLELGKRSELRSAAVEH